MDSSLIPAFAHALDLLQLHKPKPVDVGLAKKKLAAVAIVIRIQPSPDHPPPTIGYLPNTLNDFFSRPWVRHGEPEILFIKRAVRKGDRWNGHIAFPGGRYEEGDDWSRGTAVRECMEEVGLDLSGPDAIWAGELKERVVQTMWSEKPLMVLAAQVFVLTSPIPPSLRLQATEVASTHWAPISSLIDPRNHTFLYCDIADRLHIPLSEFTRQVIRTTVGQIRLPGVKLDWGVRSAKADVRDPHEELVLWGLTMAMTLDCIAGMPYIGREAVENIMDWPTLTTWDMDLWIRLLTRGMRKKRIEQLRNSDPDGESVTVQYIDGYFKQMRTAMYVGLGVRAGLILAAGVIFIRRLSR